MHVESDNSISYAGVNGLKMQGITGKKNMSRQNSRKDGGHQNMSSQTGIWPGHGN